ncbi:cytochrome P450 [Thermoactinospora rubra]|uniref:cytochrome P450 n=1 Tax=Thermoactinospora rubra TaxID=1088767 RepID=UPI00117EEE99|nr:cytochrome P450 [Thermoactinospora rubra]
MSIGVQAAPSRGARVIPFMRLLARHPRAAVRAFETAGRQADGELVRLGMGPFRPYLVTHPDHVQHVLRANQANYVRQGMFWDPLAPLLGEAILSDGPVWAASRRILQPLFTARHIASLAGRMAGLVTELIEATVRPGRPFDVLDGMSRIVHPVIVRLFFGDKITHADIARLMPAYHDGVTATSIRLVLPFVPQGFPLPGDRRFRRAIATIDGVVYPRIRAARSTGQDGTDVLSALCRALEADSRSDADQPWQDEERWLRDNLVSMHGASTETTATALSWIWPILQQHPQVAERLYAEVDRVVGGDPVGPEHLPELRYLSRVVSELLRLYPPGWMLPRLALEDDVIDGVRVPAGATVVISPFLSHRLPRFWEDPLRFDPDRFTGEREERRHRYAYFPFGGGPHQCLGSHLFLMEAQLLIAAIVSRYRAVVHADGPLTPQLASSLRPRKGLTMTLIPRERT